MMFRKQLLILILLHMFSGYVLLAQDDAIELTVENEWDQSICGLFISPMSELLWLENKIGQFQVFPPQRSLDFSVQRGIYNVAIAGCETDILYTQMNVEIDKSTIIIVDDTFIEANESEIMVARVYDRGLNVFEDPDTSSEPVTTIGVGQVAIVIDQIKGETNERFGWTSDLWFEVEVDGLIGYLWWGFVDKSQEEFIEGIQDQSGLLLDNQTDEAICAIYIKPSEVEDWQDEHKRESPYYGQTFFLPQSVYWFALEPGFHDLWFLTCESGLVVTEDRLNIQAPYVYTFDDEVLEEQSVLRLTVINESDVEICYVSVQLETDETSNWLLAEVSILPDEFTNLGIDEGTYTIVVSSCEREHIQRWNNVFVESAVELTVKSDE